MCCVTLLSLMFFMVGMQQKEPAAKSTRLSARPVAPDLGDFDPGDFDPVDFEPDDFEPDVGNTALVHVDATPVVHPREGGFRRYSSFEEYVVSSKTRNFPGEMLLSYERSSTDPLHHPLLP